MPLIKPFPALPAVVGAAGLVLACLSIGAWAAGADGPRIGAIPMPVITTTTEVAPATMLPVTSMPSMPSSTPASMQVVQQDDESAYTTPAPAAAAGARTYAANGPIYTPYEASRAPAITNAAMTPSGPVAPQDINQLRQAAQSFLAEQTQGLPGQVTISVANAAPRGLTQCEALQPFVPPGVRLWGNAMLGVRCNGEHPWTIYLQVRIGVIGDYFVATRPINAGETVGPQDLMPRHGDLTALPATVITSESQAIGATASSYIAAGFPFRADLMRAALAIRYGQAVRVVAQGNGFSVSSEGSAMANASAGQPVRVRTASGTIISGVAQADSSVNVPL